MKKKVAFICVHNSCRSQIAEALGKHLASDVFQSYSAGTETKPQINQDAVRIMKELYGIDMEETQYSKLISEIPVPDIAISMGCNVGCPFIGRAFDDNWGLEDPTGKSDEMFIATIKEIEGKILKMKNELLKQFIAEKITEYVKDYPVMKNVENIWREPVVGFADANGSYIKSLKEIVTPAHMLPEDFMENPNIVISYYIPFTEELAAINIDVEGNMAAQEWSDAYNLTNTMIADISQYIADLLTEMGYRAVPPTGVVFDKQLILSNWSQRHIAYAAGLGTFGINNMLISEKGCCGRYGSIIADIPVDPDSILTEERCLYKKNGSCKKCVQNCFSGALTAEGFDRKKCYEICMMNDAKTGADVCGKCDIDIPCAFKKP